MVDGITLTSYRDVWEAFRSKHLQQALYDEGAVVMADCVLTLHGPEHRQRRRLENRLLHRDTLWFYETEAIPASIDEVLAPAVREGRGDLLPLGRSVTMNLTAMIAGIDRPLATREETANLYRYTCKFSEGATLVHSTRDRDRVRAEVRSELDAFDAEFMAPSVVRRRDLLTRFEAGEIAEDALPRDVLTVLLRNVDDLHLPRDVLLREMAFYLQAGSHSTANAFVHTMHELFDWLEANPGEDDRVKDRNWVQRCAHEALRLHPASPIALRRSLAPVSLRGGIEISESAMVTLDLMAANRDRAAFGDDADRFDPDRELAGDVPRWGLSFGGGTHHCIGQELDGGLDESPGSGSDGHLIGSVGQMVQAVLDAGGRRDPGDPPTQDAATERKNWGSYPVVFGDA